MNYERIVHTRLFFWVTLLTLVLTLSALSREIYQNVRTKKEVGKLERTAQDLEGRNTALKETISYLQSDIYREKAARENLNLQIPGEVAVALPTAVTGATKQTGALEKSLRKDLSNARKWWAYFFGKSLEQ